MADASNSFLLQGTSGAIGKQVVAKHYGKRTVLSKYPDMSGIKPSKAQKAKRSLFAKAVAYAQKINNSASLKEAYKKKVKKGKTVYHTAIKEYLKNHAATGDK